jgi:peptidyl-prolyl cis-trans isomerase A (cyclophilin A)
VRGCVQQTAQPVTLAHTRRDAMHGLRVLPARAAACKLTPVATACILRHRATTRPVPWRSVPMKFLFALVLLAVSSTAFAQNQRVLLDTDRGPMLVELDQQRAPITSTNFLAYVDAKSFDNSLLHRVVRNFIVQGGGFKEDGTSITRRPNIASERNNGLLNRPGTLAMALSSGSNGQPNTGSANSEFFINTGTNTQLDGNYTVFGRVVYGTKTLDSINTTTLYASSETPVRAPLIKRAVRVDGFPILDLHTGGWYDPAKSGRGFGVEVANVAGSETGPLLVLYWYDYFEGKQIWMNGVKSFQWGDSQVVVPMQITRGGQFGGAFVPGDVVSDTAWGSVTVRFTACDRATFSYTSSYGSGTMDLQRLTLPSRDSCVGN